MPTLTINYSFTATGSKSVTIEVSRITGVEPLGVTFRLVEMSGFAQNDPVKALPVWDMGTGQYDVLTALNDARVPSYARFPRKTRGVYYGHFCSHVFMHADGNASPTLTIKDTDGSDFSIPFNQWRDENGDLVGSAIEPLDMIDWCLANGKIYTFSRTGDYTGAPAASADSIRTLLSDGEWNPAADPVNHDEDNNRLFLFEGGETFALTTRLQVGSNCRFSSYGTGRATLDLWSGNANGENFLQMLFDKDDLGFTDIDLYCSPVDVSDVTNPWVMWWNRLNYSSPSGFFTPGSGDNSGGETVSWSGGSATLIGENHPAFTGANHGVPQYGSVSGSPSTGVRYSNGSGGSLFLIGVLGTAGPLYASAIRGTITNGDTLSDGSGNSFVISNIPGGSAAEADNYLAVKGITGSPPTNGATITGETSGETCTYVASGSITDRAPKSSIPVGIEIRGGTDRFTLRNMTITGAWQAVGDFGTTPGSCMENVLIRDFVDFGLFNGNDVSEIGMVGVVIAQGRTVTGPHATGDGAVADNRTNSFETYDSNGTNDRSLPVPNLQRHTAIRSSQHRHLGMHYCYLYSTGGHGAQHQPLTRMWTNGMPLDANGETTARYSMIFSGCAFEGGRTMILFPSTPTNSGGEAASNRSATTVDGIMLFGNHILIDPISDADTIIACRMTNTYLYSNLFERRAGNYSFNITGVWNLGPLETEGVVEYYIKDTAAASEAIGNTYVDEGTYTGSSQAWSNPTPQDQNGFTNVFQDNLRAINPDNYSTTITDNEAVADLDDDYAVTASAAGYQAATGTGTGMVRDWTGAVRSGTKSKGYREPA